MRIHNLYEDEQGESHWRDIEVEWTEMTVGGPASSRQHASGVIFREMPVTYDLDWHVAPRRQYVIHLNGDAQITASDGVARTIKAGEIVLVEDVKGKGHLSKNISGHPYQCVFVALD
jgi:oxalate decarboxylase/phosphoglucose isomerase-like protein (cupin superfamily)